MKNSLSKFCQRIQLTWLFVADVDKKTQNNDVGQESGPPVDDKHDHTAEYSSGERNPHVVVFEAGTPSYSTTKTSENTATKGKGQVTANRNSHTV